MGKVVAPQGIRGEVRVEPWSDFPERFQEGSRLHVAGRQAVVTACRQRGNQFVLKLTGCDDRTAAESLRGCLLEVPEVERVPLPPGNYYIYELVGLEVYSVGGEQLGTLTAVEKKPAQDIYVVQGKGGELLVPALRRVIQEVDLEARRMVVDLPEGLGE